MISREEFEENKKNRTCRNYNGEPDLFCKRCFWFKPNPNYFDGGVCMLKFSYREFRTEIGSELLDPYYKDIIDETNRRLDNA
jgi:hypothetical protein